jgi:spore coat protein U-like protein
MKKLFAILIGLMMVFTAGSAFAGTTSGTADYSVTLVDGCTIDTSAMSTDFGSFFIGDPDLVNQPAGSVTISCANLLVYTWGIDKGSNPPAPAQQWLRMHDGLGNYIRYRLYEGGTELGDVGLASVAGSLYVEEWTNATYAARTATGTGAAQTYNLTADVQITDGGVAGPYTDQVTVTIVWP